VYKNIMLSYLLKPCFNKFIIVNFQLHCDAVKSFVMMSVFEHLHICWSHCYWRWKIV